MIALLCGKSGSVKLSNLPHMVITIPLVALFVAKTSLSSSGLPVFSSV